MQIIMKHSYLTTDTAYKMLYQASFLKLCIDMISEEMLKTKYRLK